MKRNKGRERERERERMFPLKTENLTETKRKVNSKGKQNTTLTANTISHL